METLRSRVTEPPRRHVHTLLEGCTLCGGQRCFETTTQRQDVSSSPSPVTPQLAAGVANFQGLC